MALIVVLFWGYVTFVAREPLFGPEQDVALGEQSVQSINEAPDQFPILSADDYPEAYAHIYRVVGELLESPEIEYR